MYLVYRVAATPYQFDEQMNCTICRAIYQHRRASSRDMPPQCLSRSRKLHLKILRLMQKCCSAAVPNSYVPISMSPLRRHNNGALVPGETSDLYRRLQLGTVNAAVTLNGLTELIAENIKGPSQTGIIVRDNDTCEVVSYAQWESSAANDEVAAELDPKVSAEHQSLMDNASDLSM
ncbi:hypothetical protein DOTSEDRAFT_31209 [Dothistroma septosporum NZE10]|uniref:Uncharacterized protein n=1 Tax=Dothistroma septosporum (strain NZE10 / CBS 128990) TaxID=675120 RepID=N1Q590_DOTSN|nr:hypothetical protein DOTSEDRAFT_31209 [Dothistroma septosporum NZE10]